MHLADWQSAIQQTWQSGSLLGLLSHDMIGMAGAAQGGVIGYEALAIKIVQAVVH